MTPLDLEKLTPAPWEVYETGIFLDTNHWYGISASAKPTNCVAKVEGAGRPSKADADFIALARNAFDVMMRRGWYPRCDSEKWWVDGEGTGIIVQQIEVPWPDPFTAIVEANAWYAANVEKASKP